MSNIFHLIPWVPMDSKEPKNHSHSIYTSFILGIDEMQGLENNRFLFDLKSNKPILFGICYLSNLFVLDC